MKKAFIGSLMFLLVFGFSSLAGAYSYSLDFQSGGISLHVAENCSLLSITTIEFPSVQDIVVDLELDLPQEEGNFEYTASLDMTFGLLGFLQYDVQLEDFSLGTFTGIDPTPLLGDGVNALTYSGSQAISGEFGGYALTGAVLDYDMTITPDSSVLESDRYSIHIDEFSLSGGNTSDLLSAVINELNQMEGVPITLSVPFTIPVTLAGTLDIQADPVPAPSAIWLLGAGVIGLAGFRRDRS